MPATLGDYVHVLGRASRTGGGGTRERRTEYYENATVISRNSI